MGTFFTFLAVRIALVVIALTSVSMVVVTAIAGNQSQSPIDPFASYADILPGQSPETVVERGFRCQFSWLPSYDESCSLILKTGIFSEIQVNLAYQTGHVSKVVFKVREQSLVLGDLARLWGKPQTTIYGHTVNFRWPNMHIVTVLQNYNGHFSYWLPITYVAFEFAK